MTASVATAGVVELPAGPIEFGDSGGSGPVLVMCGGLAMDGRLWDEVVAAIRDAVPQARCLTPTLPLGSHHRPMHAGADLSLSGLGRIVADFLAALELRDVTLVFNDWSAAPTMIADGLMDRVGRLVLTPCEAFENYPPGMAGRMAGVAGKVPGGISMLRLGLAVKPVRRLPFVYGQMSKRGVPDALMRSWLEPLRRPEIRRDLARYTGSLPVSKPQMAAGCAALGRFTKPVLVVWASEGKMMPREHGRRFADAFADAQLVELPGCYTLMPIDQPAALARELVTFVGGGSVASRRSG